MRLIFFLRHIEQEVRKILKPVRVCRKVKKPDLNDVRSCFSLDIISCLKNTS